MIDKEKRFIYLTVLEAESSAVFSRSCKLPQLSLPVVDGIPVGICACERASQGQVGTRTEARNDQCSKGAAFPAKPRDPRMSTAPYFSMVSSSLRTSTLTPSIQCMNAQGTPFTQTIDLLTCIY